MIDKNEDKLDELIETNNFKINGETGLPVKSKAGKVRNYSDMEVCSLMLPYIVEDITTSSRKLAEKIGLDPRTINKYRKSETFLRLLAEYTNKKMVGVRCLAIEELERLLKDKLISPNVKAKIIAVALQHSEKMAEIAVNTEKRKEVSIEAILKELEDF